MNMKNILVFVLVILVFCACATIGYSFAPQITIAPTAQPPLISTVTNSEQQYRLLIVHVDQLDAEKPRLVSVWYVSLFFMKETPPTLTLAQVYSSSLNTSPNAQELERSFSINPTGELAPGFWKEIQRYQFVWDGYVVTDHFANQRMLEWVNGPGDYISPFHEGAATQALLQQTCQSLSGLAQRQAAPFNWDGLIPSHYQANIQQMDIALGYWNRMINAGQPLRCDVILAQ